MTAGTNGHEKKDRVLIADDHEVNRELLELVLEDDYVVISAKDGAETLKMARAEPFPDIILLDVMMPELSGYEVCEKLKADPKTRDIPIIFITAAATQENESKGLELGAIDYITKPITPNIVLARVKNHIAYVKAQKRLMQAEKAEALGQVVAGVAHEINTPIGIMMTASSYLSESIKHLIKQRDGDCFPPETLDKFINRATESAELIVNNAQRASDLIQSFKQISADQVSGVYRTIGLAEYLQSILASLAPRLKRREVQATIDCPADLAMKTYPGTLAQIVTNLTLNAIEHAFEPETLGTIEIAIEEIDRETLRMIFTDNGRGIAEQNQGKVFEPFFTTARSLGGTGLGLSIVQSLTHETLGGTIELESENGKGTRFILEFPKETPRHRHP